jgi:uncharacterized protein YgiM (DUF1202 family)
MSLQKKYFELIETAKISGVREMDIREEDNVLYIKGVAPTGDIKNNLWSIYEALHEDGEGQDIKLEITVPEKEGTKAKVIKDDGDLDVHKGPGSEHPVIGKLEMGEVVILLSKTNEQWALIRADDGDEGYVDASCIGPA